MVSRWARWSDDAGGFWLEVFGETEPVPVPLGSLFDARAEQAARCPAYLYVCTFGYDETRRVRRDTHVKLLFPSVAGWRCKDVQAVVYHLSPVQREREWRTALAEDVRAIKPVLEVAGAATTAAGYPELGGLAAMMAHLKLRSAPQLPTGWYVKRTHSRLDGVLHQGVEWVLPAPLLRQIGTRVTGALLVQFIEAAPAREDTSPAGAAAPAIVVRARLGSRPEGPEARADLPLCVTAQ
ncbi:hypothetical protein ABZ864_27860 [Streptomyces sp. NPDC047082]|uniref:hypothetical protein n=1 Tax=Streptomyces sp. NPDC047082 TaxID=3155259 RepID=UPI00340DC2AD